MPFAALKLKPGVNTEQTPTLLEAGYESASLMRYRDGLAEKIGGWTKYYPSAVTGTPRCLHAWQTLSDVDCLGVGTTSMLGVIANSTLTDITPQTTTTNPAVNVSTSSGSTTVTIVDASAQYPSIYDYVYISIPIAVGGLILWGLYQIQSVASATQYTITASSAATATVNNGGATPTFDTSSGTTTVTVNLAAHRLSVGNYVNFPVSGSVGGITIYGRYRVITAPTADTFTIRGTSAASSSVTAGTVNSAHANYVYYITIGPAVITSASTGYVGFAALGQYALGQSYTSSPSTTPQWTGTPITATNWSLENFGELLVGCPEDGAIYYYQINGGYLTASLAGADCPPYNSGIFISNQARIMVAYGSTDSDAIGNYHDHLLVRWSDQEDFSVWAPTSLNYAGSFRIPTGSKIVGGISTRQTDLIWTDLDLWAMTYVGGSGQVAGVSLVYNFNPIGTSCGLLAKHCATPFGARTYWMGQKNFFVTNGSSVEVLPCPVWDAAFQDIDTTNAYKAWSVSSTPFNEIWWFFPTTSGGTGECDRYVKFNVVSGAWDYGPISGDTAMPRSAGVDQSVLGNPVWASPSGYLYSQESGRDADGSAISYSFRTGWFALQEGTSYPFVDEILPDFKYGLFGGAQTATVSITLYGIDNPGDTERVYGPYTVTTSTPRVTTRFRNRYMSFKLSGSDLGSFVRLGNVRFRVAPDGRR